MFSVIVRTRDRAWFLGRALRSVAQQSVRPLQVVIVVDGGGSASVDHVVDEAGLTGIAVNRVDEEVARGRGAAWNAGIRAATGDWIATLDDDDTWHPEFLSAVSEAIASESIRTAGHFGIATQTMLIAEESAGEGWREMSSEPFNGGLDEVRLRDLILGNRFTNNAFVFPRQAYESTGPIREDLPVLEDWEFNVRFAARFPIFVVRRPLANYHRREAASGSAQNTAHGIHQREAQRLREAWLRDDLMHGRFGLGVLSMLAEVEGNRGLRLANRIASLFGR